MKIIQEIKSDKNNRLDKIMKQIQLCRNVESVLIIIRYDVRFTVY